MCGGDDFFFKIEYYFINYWNYSVFNKGLWVKVLWCVVYRCKNGEYVIVEGFFWFVFFINGVLIEVVVIFLVKFFCFV